MTSRRLLSFGLPILLLLGLAYWAFFVQDSLPARSTVVVDWERVRRLAGPVEAGPRAIRSERVADGFFFGWMVCAGCGWDEVPMEFRTYQLVWDDGRSVVVDAVHGIDRHAEVPTMRGYDPIAFEHQTAALRRADQILLTHEHFDHANGLRAVLGDAAVREALRIPDAQRLSPALREAGLTEAEIASIPALADADYRAIAPGVVTFAMPGHTPGSQVVYVRRADGAEYLMLGDIVWSARNLRERRGKSRLVSLVAGEARGPLLDEIAYFADLVAAKDGPSSPFHVVVAHDPDQNAALIAEGWMANGLVLDDSPSAPPRGAPAAAPATSPADEAYQVVPGWPELAPDVALGETSGVGVDSHGHVFVFHRGKGPSILGLEPGTGRVAIRFGEGVFVNPHGLAIGPNDEVWVTDTLRQQVLRFSHDGELLATFGEQGVAGTDLAHFDQPTDLAFASTGEFFVSDGYGNSRVVRYSKAGKPVASFGRKGKAPGEFDLPHGITIDARDRLYVADRGNQRVQVFDLDGKPLAAWGTEVFGPDSRAWGVEVFEDRLYVVDGGHMDPTRPGLAHLTRLDLDGHVEAQWSRYGGAPGELAWGHDLAVGPDGAVYTAEVRINDRAQKFVPKPAAPHAGSSRRIGADGDGG